MRTDENQYLPNTYIVQLNYKPQSRILDQRGVWTALLADQLGLSEWIVSENQLLVTNPENTIRAMVGFKSCGYEERNVRNGEDFARAARGFLSFVFSGDRFGSPFFISRVGTRGRFCTAYTQPFETLLRKFRERYIDIKPDALDAIGNVTLTDIGAPCYFEDDVGQFKTMCGPMTREQAVSEYFKGWKPDDLPEVGLYYDIDYYKNPNDEITEAGIGQSIENFVQESWNRHRRIRKLIIGA